MKLSHVFFLIVCLSCGAAIGATYSSPSNPADQEIGLNASGEPVLLFVGQNAFLLGDDNVAYNRGSVCGVAVFALPDLGGETIDSASLSFDLYSGYPGGVNDWPKGLDLYGVRYASSPSVLLSDYAPVGAAPVGNGTLIQDDVFVMPSNGSYAWASHQTDATGDAALAAWLAAQYAAGAQPGDYVFLRLNVDKPTANSVQVASANNTAHSVPTLTISTDAAGPEANAGEDQTVQADLQNNPVTVTLDGSSSTPDDSVIADYAWTENGSPVASGMTATAAFAVGEHLVVLTVVDVEGDMDSDTVLITILDGSPIAPVADAGPDQALDDGDGDGSEAVTLDGTGSYAADPRATLVSAAWTDAEGTVVSTAFTATLTLAEGYHPMTLTVTDSHGLSDSDTVNIAVGREQLLNLPLDRPDFPVPADIVWPDAVGEPHLCLWYGDKFAALTITIDDNWKPDHAWWIQMAQTYGFTPTWFVIVDPVENASNPGFSGVWADFAALAAAGGSIQSHTMTHDCSDAERPDADVRWEYQQSQALINANVPDQQCLAVAYPCGAGKRNLAAECFIAGRGTTGTPNKAARINWMSTCSAGSAGTTADFVDAVLYGTSGITWLNSSQWKRSWLCTHFHGVGDAAAVEAQLAYIDSVGDLFWWASFVDVAKFGQERDSAEITVVENSESRIAFEITDRMNDLIFDHPLTIKLRLSDAWGGAATATQNGTPTACTLTTEGDYDYILLDAIPDRGLVEILPGAAAKPGDADGDGDVDLDDFVLLKTNFGMTSGAAWGQGDFDGDGDVDLDDFVILKTSFGT